MRPCPLLTSLVALLALAAAGCKGSSPGVDSAPQDAIWVGHVASMTGSEATNGQSSDAGIRLAMEQWNARGGVKGKKLQLRTYDIQGKAEEAAVAATRLARNDKVALLIGAGTSSPSLAMAPIADTTGTPMIAPSATNPRVTMDRGKVRPYVFRVCFIDPFQGDVAARFAAGDLKARRAAILRDVGSDYSMGLAEVFAARFRELGGAIVDDQGYKSGDQDFKAQLTALRGLDPDLIYLPGYYTDVSLIARQARELGMRQTFLGGDGLDSAVLLEIGGKAVEGTYFTNHYSPDDPSPRIQDFVTAYRRRFGRVPDGPAAQAYDAAMVGFAAMDRAPEPSGPALRDAIAATRDHAGVTGVISLNGNHDAVKPAVVLRVKDGKVVYVTTIPP